MASIKLTGDTSGEITISAPAVSGTNTLTLPANTGNIVTDSATQTLTNKTLTTPNIDSAQFATVSGTAPLYAARAWVNFDGTGTPAIRESGNVSSITDNGAGDYTINFTNAMPDANYCVASLGSRQFAATAAAVNALAWLVPNGATTTSVGVTCTQTNTGFSVTASLGDYPNLNVAIFR